MQKPQPPDIPARPFGDEHTWADVISHVSRIVRQKFPVYDYDTLQDVLGDVQLDLLGYWSSLASSRKEDGTFSFRFAIQRGCWMGKRKMWEAQEHNRRQTRRSWGDDDAEGGFFDDDGFDGGAEPGYRADYFVDEDPTPETVIEELDEHERARRVLASLTPEELRDYFDTLLTDETERQAAARLGHSQPTQHRRVVAARENLKDRAVRYGLAN